MSKALPEVVIDHNTEDKDKLEEVDGAALLPKALLEVGIKIHSTEDKDKLEEVDGAALLPKALPEVGIKLICAHTKAPDDGNDA